MLSRQLIKISSSPATNRGNQGCHDSDIHPPSLGCEGCYEKAVCGGLQTTRGPFNCIDYCCRQPQSCDSMCRMSPRIYTRRLREINGFELDNIPRAQILDSPDIPLVVPILFHGSKRREQLKVGSICLPLYNVISTYRGKRRFRNLAQLSKKYGFHPNATIVLTGTHNDVHLERWWSLSLKRIDEIRALKDLGVSLVTTPNYSVFKNAPRWENFHNIKRIAIVHEEFLREGMPAALHINARTDRDWDRWIQFIADRREITHLSYEFGTGAKSGQRRSWHIAQLKRALAHIGRPIHLVTRGGTSGLLAAGHGFKNCTILDSNLLIKTIKRQLASLGKNDKLVWYSLSTKPDEPLDRLFQKNWKILSVYYRRRISIG